MKSEAEVRDLSGMPVKFDSLFNPESVTIIGASKDPTKWGLSLLLNILSGGFYDLDGQIPCQVDGGLKCFGYPIGASGLRMIYALYEQILQRVPEERKVKNTRIGLAHNLGEYPAITWPALQQQAGIKRRKFNDVKYHYDPMKLIIERGKEEQ